MQLDPTRSVDLEDPGAVLAAIDALLRERFGADYGSSLLELAITDLARAFRGEYAGLLRCDTHYHDLRHAMDSGLAMARLIDGQAASTAADSLEFIDAEHALLGILLALYHDIGMLRRDNEGHLQGAQLTPVHEARGVEFMHDYLKRSPLAHLARKAALIMVTRLDWHMPPGMDRVDRALSCLLGTADLQSQLADRCYLEKCRDFLYLEFSAIGLAGSPGLPYPDPETLLKNTPNFYTGLLRRRIQDDYAGADKFMRRHFGGDCPYDESIRRNIGFLEELLANDQLSRLQRLPKRVIDARL
jgi:hypothetical protein